MSKDKTLLDNNRTLLNLFRSEIDNVLPEFYAEEYPNIHMLFDGYYDWMNDSDNPGGRIKRLYASRDATQVPENLLPYLEDELLLGQAYFGGFINKREAIKRSNLLYRSKGTKYSIEQFFRAFFGIDPQVVYPKENIFKIGPSIDYDQSGINNAGEQIKEEASKIGPESRKYITDDKLYQVMAILIRVGIPVKDWSEVYKLFVHPAGVYLGSEILIEVVNDNIIITIQEREGDPIPEFISQTGIATMQAEASISITLLGEGDADQPIIRQSIDTYFDVASATTIEQASEYTIRELISPNSMLLDDSDGIVMSEDSDGTREAIIINRFDESKFSTQYDSA